MKKLGIIQESLGNFFLSMRTKRNDRKPQVFSFQNAKTIGILYDASEKIHHEKISEFADFITHRYSGITIKMLGYLDNPEMATCLSQSVHTEFFSQKDFSWSGNLQKGSAVPFTKERFDILLDINNDTSYPLLYVLLLSKASYKVGRFIETDLRYDLMLDTKEDNTIEFLITQINVYLSKIRVKQ